MINVNTSKLLVALATIGCLTVLMASGAVEQAVGIPVITTVLGYMLGNGVAAIRGNDNTPIVGRSNT